MILDKHYWWTNDQKAVVPHGHPDAAFLAFAKGHELADALARKHGILKEHDAEDDTADAKDDAKAKPAPANKARAKTADKSDGK